MSIKSCPKTISLEKWQILTPLQKSLRMWEIWANLLFPKALKVAQSPINRPIWSHCYWASLFSLEFSLNSLKLSRKRANKSLTTSRAVWPDLAKIHHFCHILKGFGYFRNLHLALGISLNLLWKIFDAIRQIFIGASGQILTNLPSGHTDLARLIKFSTNLAAS